MTTFFIDLWQDLREKRLWPIAVGLLAATAAVPLLLFKPASPAAPQPPLPTASQGPRLPAVSVDSGPVEGSDLTQFSSKNPFIPLSDLQTSGSSSGSTQSGASQPSSPSVSSASAGGSPAAPAQAQGGGSSAGGGSSTPAGSPTVHWFRYTVDIKFGTPGKLKTIDNVQTLKMLPSTKQPVVIFMGVTTDGGHAIFFVDDPTYSASGKGTCNVSGDACRFVTLTPTASSETFTSADGKTKYKLQLLKVNRQSFTPKSSKTSKSSVRSAGHGMLGDLDAAQLVPEILSLTGAAESG